MQKQKVAGWSMASSFVNSQIGIRPYRSLSGFSFNRRRLGSVSLTGGLHSEFAGTVGVHLGRADQPVGLAPPRVRATLARRIQKDQLQAEHTIPLSHNGHRASARPPCSHKESAV